MRVELNDVRRQFGNVLALDGVSLDIAPGERVALVGPNGSGKSTLLRAVMGIVRCEGTVRLDGRDPFRDRAALAARLACVPQTAPRLRATVGELSRAVATLRCLDADRIRSTAARIGLDLDALRRQPLGTLSGGTRQKLLIALALAAPASLVILDEPTASLDRDAREAFFRLFEERAAGATLLLSSHRLGEIRRLVDRVVALEAGRVAVEGPITAPEIAHHMNDESGWHDGPDPTAWTNGRRAS